ncbi:protein FAM216A isoform X2 [Betta splendens]|uniref:Protein FAM216A isoform X2 n=1 Tax=Betta splendens TaxID=158456 RepID=A0A6P7LL09_BETSP|nr:protein FAM216A isoform X2 [Betta splendens]
MTTRHSPALKPAGVHLDTHRLPTARPDSQTTAGPFRKHAAPTPAQRQYLCTIAASYSPAHVRKLLAQHYVSILNRSIRTGIITDRDNLVVASQEENHLSKSQSEVLSAGKQKGKTKSNTKHSKKIFLPKIPLSNSVPKKKKTKKHTTASPKTKPTPRARIRRAMEEKEEEGLNGSLTECLSSLSVGGWTDSSSDLSTGVVKFR